MILSSRKQEMTRLASLLSRIVWLLIFGKMGLMVEKTSCQDGLVTFPFSLSKINSCPSYRSQVIRRHVIIFIPIDYVIKYMHWLKLGVSNYRLANHHLMLISILIAAFESISILSFFNNTLFPPQKSYTDLT